MAYENYPGRGRTPAYISLLVKIFKNFKRGLVVIKLVNWLIYTVSKLQSNIYNIILYR